MSVSTSSRSRLVARSWRPVALLAAAALVVLSACTPVQAGAAAIVGEATLTQAEVADLLQEINTVADDSRLDRPVAADVNSRLVATWVEESLTEELALREDVTVTDGEVDQFLSQFGDQQLAEIAVTSAIPPSALRRAAETQLLQVELAGVLDPNGNAESQGAALRTALSEVAADLGVSVNPRFGSFDAEAAQVIARDDLRLSSPVPAASETATGPTQG